MKNTLGPSKLVNWKPPGSSALNEGHYTEQKKLKKVLISATGVHIFGFLLDPTYMRLFWHLLKIMLQFLANVLLHPLRHPCPLAPNCRKTSRKCQKCVFVALKIFIILTT